MQVARWHVGKLVLFWVMCAIGFLLAGSGASAVSDRAETERMQRAAWQADETFLQRLSYGLRLPPDSIQRLLAAQLVNNADKLSLDIRSRFEALVAHPHSSPRKLFGSLQWLLGAAAALAFLAPFVITWRWFGAREARKGAAV